MTDIQLAIWSLPILLVLILIRIPIALAMMLIGFAGTYMVFGSPNNVYLQLKNDLYSTFSNDSFAIIPLFLLMGQFATLSGMSAALFKAGESFLGHRKGGVAMSAIAACAGFGSIAGSRCAFYRRAGCWWHARHSHSAVRDFGDPCDLDRTKHRKTVPSCHDSRSGGRAWLHAHDPYLDVG